MQNQAVAGGLLSLKSWTKQFPEIDTTSPNLTAKQVADHAQIQGTTVAIYTAAGIFGALFCIWSGDRFGRKMTIALGAIAAGIGAIIQCSSYSLAQLIVGRVIAGLGNGGIVAVRSHRVLPGHRKAIADTFQTVPNLQAETAPPEKRGAVVQYLSVFALAGLAVAAWIGLGLSFTDPDPVAWRFPMAMPLFFVLLILAGLTFAPESPRWLVSVGKVEDARETFSALYNLDPHDPKIEAEINEVQQSMVTAGDLGFKDAFKMGPNRLVHRLLIACGIQTFQQLTGVNCLAYYEKTIFSGLGLNAVDAGILSGAVFTFSALVSMVGVWTVDRFGRRPLLLISVLGNGICMAVIAGCSSQTNSKAAQAVATLFVFLFFFFFPVGFLGVTFLYAAEISPLSIRGPITALSTACVCMCRACSFIRRLR